MRFASFLLVGILMISSIGILSLDNVFAQSLGMSIDVSSTNNDNTIHVNGYTKSDDTDITLTVTSPSNNIVSIGLVSPDTDGNFAVDIIVSPTWTEDGFYSITVMQGVSNSVYTLNAFVEIIDGLTKFTSVTVSNLEPDYSTPKSSSGYDVPDECNESNGILNCTDEYGVYTCNDNYDGSLDCTDNNGEFICQYAGNEMECEDYHTTYSSGDVVSAPWINPSDSSTVTPTYPSPAPYGTDVIIQRDTGVSGCEDYNSCYSPYKITVDESEKITWYNADSAAHTVTSGTPTTGTDEIFDSVLILSGESFSHTIYSSGTYDYFCMLHPWMQGLVIVQPSNNNPEPTSTVSVWTDKTDYGHNDMINVKGQVGYVSGSLMTLTVISPLNSIVVIDQLAVAKDGSFKTTLNTASAMWKYDGIYTIKANYGSAEESNSAKVELTGGVAYTPDYSPSNNSQITSNTISVQGSSDLIKYEIQGGKLQNVISDYTSNSLIISVDATSDGSITLSIPRTILDASINNEDDDFFILVDGEEVNYDGRTSSYDRTLTIVFPRGAEDIEIIGTGEGATYSEPVCGRGTELVNGICQVIADTKQESITISSIKVWVDTNNNEGISWGTASVRNTGDTILSVDKIQVRGTNASMEPVSLIPGQSATIDFNIANGVLIPLDVGAATTVTIFAGNTSAVPQSVTVGGTSSSTPIPAPTISGTISVSTDDYQYSPNDLVTLKVTTSTSANVAVSVVGPSGDSIVSRSVSTDSRGNGSLQFKLHDSSLDGSYKVNTSATISGSNISDSTTFSVKSSVAKISIITLQPTDQQGNAVSSFTTGKLGFVKVGLSSSSTVNSLVTINLFDSELTTLGIGSLQTNLSSGKSEMTLSFFIPNDAELGNGDIYANVFSDWPSRGGAPLTGESSIQVRIQ